MFSVPICTVPQLQLLVPEGWVDWRWSRGVWRRWYWRDPVHSIPVRFLRELGLTMYNIGVSSSYALSPSADFQTSFAYSSLSFGGSYTPTTTTSGQALVFDTTSYSVTAGPTARISASDSLGFNYIFSQFSQANFGNFSTHSGQGTWGRSWSREISSSVRWGDDPR